MPRVKSVAVILPAPTSTSSEAAGSRMESPAPTAVAASERISPASTQPASSAACKSASCCTGRAKGAQVMRARRRLVRALSPARAQSH